MKPSAVKMFNEIQEKRIEMLQLAEMYGMTDELTIRSSQELDVLINEYSYVQKNHVFEEKFNVNNMIMIVQQPFSYLS
ncbi:MULTISPECIES: aspartyl-phosphate phosphatase Spo0E family protein [Bacillaceae]|uniref:Stage 0 sporulation regulatory protein n=1 Tax=Peribacillus huizhouensis TaxID=1501239 RepID=A0ABR6CJ69_9BACI|nr:MULTISPECIES: aspartyl-phosphate phosphatase Spo0E family protein [Bacillaceae]MBA9025070.1 stage 0 sporulation regulatory protein [Peribacillus huizhouensis]